VCVIFSIIQPELHRRSRQVDVLSPFVRSGRFPSISGVTVEMDCGPKMRRSGRFSGIPT